MDTLDRLSPILSQIQAVSNTKLFPQFFLIKLLPIFSENIASFKAKFTASLELNQSDCKG